MGEFTNRLKNMSENECLEDIARRQKGLSPREELTVETIYRGLVEDKLTYESIGERHYNMRAELKIWVMAYELYDKLGVKKRDDKPM